MSALWTIRGSISTTLTEQLHIPRQSCQPERCEKPSQISDKVLRSACKEVWGYGKVEETPVIPVEPDDSTPIHALHSLAVDELASGS